MLKIDALIFDLGGVILDLCKDGKEGINGSNAMSILFGISLGEADDIWNKNKNGILVGSENPEQFIERIKKHLGDNRNTLEILNQWNFLGQKTDSIINYELLSKIQKWRESYKVYALSDAFDVAQRDNVTNDLRHRFDGFFLSYEQGYVKPSIESYENLLSKTGQVAKNCIFVDDIEINVEGAKKAGMKAVQFTSNSKLLDDFASYGIY